MGSGRARNVCVLTEIYYGIEFKSEPSDEVIQALVSGLKKGEGRLRWDLDGNEWADDFFNPESTGSSTTHSGCWSQCLGSSQRRFPCTRIDLSSSLWMVLI